MEKNKTLTAQQKKAVKEVTDWLVGFFVEMGKTTTTDEFSKVCDKILKYLDTSKDVQLLNKIR